MLAHFRHTLARRAPGAGAAPVQCEVAFEVMDWPPHVNFAAIVGIDFLARHKAVIDVCGDSLQLVAASGDATAPKTSYDTTMPPDGRDALADFASACEGKGRAWRAEGDAAVRGAAGAAGPPSRPPWRSRRAGVSSRRETWDRKSE